MTDSWPVQYFKAGAAAADTLMAALRNRIWDERERHGDNLVALSPAFDLILNWMDQIEEKHMADGASSCEFFVEGGGSKGRYLMYNPPITGDDITFGDGDTYTVVRRNVDVQDNFVRITIRRKDSA